MFEYQVFLFVFKIFMFVSKISVVKCVKRHIFLCKMLFSEFFSVVFTKKVILLLCRMTFHSLFALILLHFRITMDKQPPHGCLQAVPAIPEKASGL